MGAYYLRCKHETDEPPMLGNPKRWWCDVCRTFQPKVTRPKGS